MTSEVTQADREFAILACRLTGWEGVAQRLERGWTPDRDTNEGKILEAAVHHRLTAQSGEQQSCEPIATVEMIETVTGDFYTDPGEPIWRVMVGEYCADFDSEQAARNFASAINLAAQSGEGRSGAGEDEIRVPREPTDDMVQAGLYQVGVGGDEWAMVYQIWVDMFDSLTLDGGCTQSLPAALNARQSGEGEREAIRTALYEGLQWFGSLPEPQGDVPCRYHRWDDLGELADRVLAALRATDDAGGA